MGDNDHRRWRARPSIEVFNRVRRTSVGEGRGGGARNLGGGVHLGGMAYSIHRGMKWLGLHRDNLGGALERRSGGDYSTSF